MKASVMPPWSDGLKKLSAVVAVHALMMAVPVTIELPYENASCAYGCGTTLV